MQKLFTIIAAILLSVTLWAQAPQKMSYQAVIRNSTNQLISNHAVGIKVSILHNADNGGPVYTEVHTTNTNSNGLVTIEIGNGTVLSGGAFSSINWADGTYFIKTETDPTGGTNYSITGTSQILSVPYAIHATTAETLTGTINETDPSFNNWDKSTGISITASQVSDFQTNVTNNATVLANTAKNSYPTADATKLAGIATGAEVNVNADWNAVSGDAQILNKPTTIAGYGITDAVTTSGNQTIAGNKTYTDTIKATLNANNAIISNVAEPILSNDAANKAYVDVLRKQIQNLEDLLFKGTYSLSDIEGNVYNTVTIGKQVWMVENLKTTKYNNGDIISTTNPATLDIRNESTPKYQWAYDGNESNVAIYGRLYTWYAANDSRNVCPTGWHLPSNMDWIKLTDFLTNNGFGYGGSGSDIAKSLASTTGWSSYPDAGFIGNNQETNNSSGFTAQPGGIRNGIAFLSINNDTYMWSSTEVDFNTAHIRMLNFGSANVYGGSAGSGKSAGFAVRCLRD